MAMQCEVLHYLYYLLFVWLEFHGNQDIWHKDYRWKQTESEDIIYSYNMKGKKRQEIIHWRADSTDAGSFECSNEPLDSIKGRKFFNSSVVSVPTRTASCH
jgi:hypothetical protein